MTEKPSISHSEEVRERRTREQVKRRKQTTERAYRTMPPVTSRDRPVLPVRKPARKSARKPASRRYNAAMGIPHAQSPWSRISVLLPDMQAGPRLYSLILVLLLSAGIYFLAASPEFRVSEPQINGLTRLSAAEINSVMGLSGDLIFLLKPEEITARLRSSFPELESAQVRIALPNTVIMDVQERQPVLLWQQGAGYTWIDEHGVAFRPHGEAPGLIPVVAQVSPPGGEATDPLSPAAYVAPGLVKTAMLLAANLPAGSALSYDADNGFGWVDSRGWQAYFGADPKDVALKLRIYQSLVDSLAARGIYPALISVVHADAPYYRMEQ